MNRKVEEFTESVRDNYDSIRNEPSDGKVLAVIGSSILCGLATALAGTKLFGSIKNYFTSDNKSKDGEKDVWIIKELGKWTK